MPESNPGRESEKKQQDSKVDSPRRTFNHVLLMELEELRKEPLAGFASLKAAQSGGEAGPTTSGSISNPGDTLADQKEQRNEELTRIYAAIHKMDSPLAALCLSGGGIRSATFNLGVIQALAGRQLLGKIDYLSTVSGGGYIGGWLAAWLRREKADKVFEKLSRRAKNGDVIPTTTPLAPESDPIDNLREYSNYLTPRLGIFSADTWTIVAIFLRNLLLTWSVILPILAAFIAIPQLSFLLLQAMWKSDGDLWLVLIGASLVVLLIASFLLHSIRVHPGSERLSNRGHLGRGILPIWIATMLLAAGAYRMPLQSPARYAWFALLWSIGIPMLGWMYMSGRRLMARKRMERDQRNQAQSSTTEGGSNPRQEPQSGERSIKKWLIEAFALLVSGALGGVMLVLAALHWLPYLRASGARYVTLALPLMFGIYLLTRTISVAISTLAESVRGERPEDGKWRISRAGGDSDREWWARLSAWILMGIVGWMAIAALSLFGARMIEVAGDGIAKWIAGAGGVAGVLTALLGRSGKTGSAHPQAQKSGLMDSSLALGAMVFCVCLAALLGSGTALLGQVVTGDPRLFTEEHLYNRYFGIANVEVNFFWMWLGLIIPSFLMSFAVNVNRFSMHAMYRNRLVRAYLGASNVERNPDPFTGFDDGDNLKLASLSHEELATRARSTVEPGPEQVAQMAARQAADESKKDPKDPVRPFLVINTALNLVKSGPKLAWQQRKAESFSMTPLYCGNFYGGYRDSRKYASGITLGTAMTISGAAVSPNMGYHSSPAVTFLLGLFNVRLGAWLGNTNAHGDKTHRNTGPVLGVLKMFADLLGYSDATRKYVSLSDGGHFDNLGMYEMVLRRVRRIIVCDAGADETFNFEDLGNAIRKIRIDFGIPITFQRAIEIKPKGDGEPGLYCAYGKIEYACVDGKVEPGEICYIKPTVLGKQRIPYDITSYSRGSKTFPHETTADQFFDESQFESYRALGVHAIESIADTPDNAFGTPPAYKVLTLEEFFEQVKKHTS